MRLLIAEDHTLVRAGMRLLLESIPGMTVVGEAVDGVEALRVIAEHRPDCVVLATPARSGLEALKRSTARFPEVRILVLSRHADEEYVQEALGAGAAGYMLTRSDKAELELALRSIAQGETYISPGISKTVVPAPANNGQPPSVDSRIEALTLRQREVLRLVAEGFSTKRVAAQLGLSAKTVEAHRGAIMQRLGIRDLAGLVRFAVRSGLVAKDR